MFSIDDKDIKRLEKDLKLFKRRALPFATKNTINSAAFGAQKRSRIDLKENFVLRNRFTVQSVQVDQTRTLNIRRQAAHVGSTEDYMEDQEFGGVKTKGGKEGTPITTSYAAGQGLGNHNRTRLARKPNRLLNIKLKGNKLKGAKNSKQATILKTIQAVKTGKRIVYFDFRGRKKKGIYRVVGGRITKKGGMPRGVKLRMLHDLSETSVRVPSRPWLAPAVKLTERTIPALYKKSLMFQLRRHRVLGY